MENVSLGSMASVDVPAERREILSSLAIHGTKAGDEAEMDADLLSAVIATRSCNVFTIQLHFENRS